MIPHPDTLRIVLLLVLAAALGMQNNAFHQIGPVKLSTAFISGNLENVGEAIAESEDLSQREYLESTGKRCCGPRFFLRHGLPMERERCWVPMALSILR